MEVTKVFTQVAYDQEDYYHSVQWLEESVRLFRGTGSKWRPENEGTLHDALDHLAFSHFMVCDGNPPNAVVTRLLGDRRSKISFSCQTGNVSHALSLSQELLHYGKAFPFTVSSKMIILSSKPKHFHKKHPMSEFSSVSNFPLDPLNGRVLQNIYKYEKLLASNSSKSVAGLKRPSCKYLRTRDTYERLCQTRGSQVRLWL